MRQQPNQDFKVIKHRNLQNLLRSFNFKILFAVTSLHLIFIIIFDKVTAFAPDEVNYIAIFNNLYKSDFSLDGYLGWQKGSINALRVIYLPAKLLQIFGLSDFYVVRLLAVFYSMLSLYLLLKMASEVRFLRLPIKLWITVAYVVPSFFLWSSLGLRESFIYFSLISIFYFLVNPQDLNFRTQFLLLVAVNTFFLISKMYLYGLLLLCLAASFLILSLLKRNFERSTLKLYSAFLIPLLFFPSIATTFISSAKGSLEVKLISPTTTPTTTPTTKPTTTPTTMIPSRGQTLHDLNQQFSKNSILAWLATATGIQSILDERTEASYLPSGSEELIENTNLLQNQPASLRDPMSLLIGAYNFLFVPTPFVDNGSFFLNTQSYESFAWYLYYLILILLFIGLLRNRYNPNLATVASGLFTLGFIALSALIEINDGTSVRHRSVVLIGILVMLVTFRTRETSQPRHKDPIF